MNEPTGIELTHEEIGAVAIALISLLASLEEHPEILPVVLKDDIPYLESATRQFATYIVLHD